MDCPAPENVTHEPRRPHMEVMNPATGDVWLLQEPLNAEDYAAVQLEPPFVKSGFTSGAMDAAWFSRSPGAAAEGPLETRVLGGRTFARVAKVRRFTGLAPGNGPTLVRVEKHHVLTFAAGRAVAVVRLPAGHCYVEQTEAIPGRGFVAPAGWRLAALTLTAPWTVRFDGVADVWFFTSLRSFIGPLAVANLPGLLTPL